MRSEFSRSTEIPSDLAQHIADTIHGITGGKVNVMGEGGIILGSPEPHRIGTVHEGGRRIMAGEVDEIAITPEMAESMTGALPGYNGVVMLGHHRVGCIGIGGDPDTVRPLQKMAAIIVTEELLKREEQQKRREMVAEFSARIRDIAERMSVLALNGSIQASRLGAKGAPFKVVAGEMRELSNEVARITDSMDGSS